MTTTKNPRAAIHTPAETARLTVQRIQDMEQSRHRAMPFFVDKIRGYFADLMPGDTCGVLAQTSNFKTGAMTIWERQLAAYLRNQGRENEVIFHVDVENTVEALGMSEAARLSRHTVADLSRGNVHNWAAVIQAADAIAGIEVYRIADRLGKDDIPDLYLSNIYRAIDYAVSGKLYDRPLKPAAIFIDYLQALPLDPEVKRSTSDIEKQRRLQVREDLYRIRRMGNYFSCPVIVGIQAKQHLAGNSAGTAMPGVYDGEETSAIAQRLDRLVSLWMPKMTHTLGDTIRLGTNSYDVTETLLLVKVLKQRGGLPSGRAWVCNIDYDKGIVRAE